MDTVGGIDDMCVGVWREIRVSFRFVISPVFFFLWS